MTQQTEAALRAVAIALVVLLALASAVLWLASCCKTCPPPVVREVPVKVPVPCTLPPSPVLPGVRRDVANCPGARVCFDIPNAAKLAERESKMKTWIREATAACAPATRPAP